MRVFLRNKRTRLYRAASNGWAATVGQALDFISVAQAARFALDKNLPEIEIILKSDMVSDEVVLPLLPEWGSLDLPGPAAN